MKILLLGIWIASVPIAYVVGEPHLRNPFNLEVEDTSYPSCGYLEGGDWKPVRHVPGVNNWHPATDQLRGTDTYGNPGVPQSPWSINFETAVPDWNQFLFSTGNCAVWLVANREAVIGIDGNTYYNYVNRDIVSSSTSTTPYQAKWYRRVGVQRDPWISVRDVLDDGSGYGYVVYGGNDDSRFLTLKNSNNGADVYVRNMYSCGGGGKDVTSCEKCMNGKKFDEKRKQCGGDCRWIRSACVKAIEDGGRTDDKDNCVSRAKTCSHCGESHIPLGSKCTHGRECTSRTCKFRSFLHPHCGGTCVK